MRKLRRKGLVTCPQSHGQVKEHCGHKSFLLTKPSPQLRLLETPSFPAWELLMREACPLVLSSQHGTWWCSPPPHNWHNLFPELNGKQEGRALHTTLSLRSFGSEPFKAKNLAPNLEPVTFLTSEDRSSGHSLQCKDKLRVRNGV